MGSPALGFLVGCIAADTAAIRGAKRLMIGPADDGAMPILVAAVLTMSAAQLFDLGTFVTMVGRVGPGAEANPLVGALFGLGGFPMVAIAKVAMLALVSAIGAILVIARPKLAAGVIAIAIVIGLLGGLSNSAAIGALPLV